ncbi:hypothetical protein CARUB_v100039531mg, partial [Capsella rubella]
MLIFYSLFF